MRLLLFFIVFECLRKKHLAKVLLDKSLHLKMKIKALAENKRY